jgi:hypothetical protein
MPISLACFSSIQVINLIRPFFDLVAAGSPLQRVTAEVIPD